MNVPFGTFPSVTLPYLDIKILQLNMSFSTDTPNELDAHPYFPSLSLSKIAITERSSRASHRNRSNQSMRDDFKGFSLSRVFPNGVELTVSFQESDAGPLLDSWAPIHLETTWIQKSSSTALKP